MKSKSISEDQPDNDTCDHSNPTSLKPLCNTSNGFEKILSCFGLMREKEQPGKNVLAMNGHSQRLNGVVSSEFDVAAAKLLRQNFRKELPLPRQCTRVKHIQQLESWDCGIACIQMTLRWLRDMDIETNSGLTSEEVDERKLLLESAVTRSIWTVDLLRLLESLLKKQNDNPRQPNHSNASYLFCSEVHGVNHSHSTTGYYAKAFDNDSVRVSKIFDEIVRQQLPMLCPFHLKFREVLEVASFKNCIAIVLVDNYVLMHPLIHELDKNSKEEDGGTLSTANHNTDTYAGHYVILCGKSFDSDHIKRALAWERKTYNSERDSYCLVLSNPGIPDQTMFVTPQLLERAWRAEGTDCDIIFIAKHRRT